MMLSLCDVTIRKWMQSHSPTFKNKQIKINIHNPQILLEIEPWDVNALLTLIKQQNYTKKPDVAHNWLSDSKREIERKMIANDEDALSDFERSKKAFNDFVKNNVQNPKFSGKYVVFINGQYQGVGDSKIDLVTQMYRKFGNVAMYAGCVSQSIQPILIESPEMF